jgi:hypothetical protein
MTPPASYWQSQPPPRTTPPPDPATHFTKQSTALPYTSGHIIRDETLMALGDEMAGYVVGPMPPKDFLKFLPPNSRKLPSFNKGSFAKIKAQPTEVKIYDSFVRIPSSSPYP